MTVDTERLEKAIAGFDAFNNEDPNRETFEGEEHPKELLYARRMTGWLEKLAPDASDALRLAVRCQHIGRWSIRRDEYPEGVKGYHQWRGALAEYHAQTAGGIMGEVGYDAGAISRVQQLVRKQKLKTDPETRFSRTWRAWCSWKTISPSSPGSTTTPRSAASSKRPGPRCRRGATGRP